MAEHSRKKKKQKKKKSRTVALVAILLVVACACLTWIHFSRPDPADVSVPNWIEQDFIDKDGHSRTGWALDGVKDIVVHYVANPGSSAADNRSYFNSPSSTTSAHFIVGLQGEIIQCVPMDEQSSASNQRNPDTISIEVCHPDSTGEFSIPTYNALVKLLVWLCQEFRLDEDNIIRHYDITGKNCPKFYVEHPDEWELLKNYVRERL